MLAAMFSSLPAVHVTDAKYEEYGAHFLSREKRRPSIDSALFSQYFAFFQQLTVAMSANSFFCKVNKYTFIALKPQGVSHKYTGAYTQADTYRHTHIHSSTLEAGLCVDSTSRLNTDGDLQMQHFAYPQCHGNRPALSEHVWERENRFG